MFKIKGFSGPADGVMAMLLDSHVVNCGSHPGPGDLKLMPGACACMRKILRENGGEGIVAWPSPLGGDFSFSVSVSVCLASAHAPYSKNLSKEKPKKNPFK